MRDSAFIDRIHGMLPGWELPKIMKAEKHLSQNYGLVIDYFCEILHELRKMDFQHYISEHVTLGDEKGIRKLASGMLKILSPHGDFNEYELRLSMDTALEYRQRIADWLYQLATGEFRKKQMLYHLK